MNREQEWRSGESTRLPPMWPGFEYVIGVLYGLCLLLVLLLSQAQRDISRGTPVFPSPQNTSISKYQFDLDTVDEGPLVIPFYLFNLICIEVYANRVTRLNSIIKIHKKDEKPSKLMIHR